MGEMYEVTMRGWHKEKHEFYYFTLEDLARDFFTARMLIKPALLRGDLIVTQYSGIVDKYDVDIFKGDIVAIGEEDVPEKANCEVGFSEGRFVIFASWLEKDNAIELRAYKNAVFVNCIEVIGNIYESPELRDA